jgi:hypothetical protein
VTPTPPRSREPEEPDNRATRDVDATEIHIVPPGKIAVFEAPRGGPWQSGVETGDARRAGAAAAAGPATLPARRPGPRVPD